MRFLSFPAFILFLSLLLSACDTNQPAEPPKIPAPSEAPSVADSTGAVPPAPPLNETFDAEPQLSLFPRVGGSRPEDDNAQGLGIWSAYIDHIQRTSGMAAKAGRNQSAGWLLHGIKGLDSIAFFAPLAVKPSTPYSVSFDLKGELPKGASAGIGVIEFDQFLWVSEQFTDSMIKKHQTGAYPGISVTTKSAWKTQTFSFTTSPRAGMIHLVLFREGPMDREKPVFFDNIAIKEQKLTDR